MKKFIKNNIKTFMTILITTIIVGSVSVYAASQYFAKDISFTPTNENFKKENGEPIDNVEDAINELYERENKFFFDSSNMITNVAYYKGNRLNGQKVSLILTKGKYLVFVANDHSLGNNTNYTTNGEYNKNTLSLSNGKCELIKGYNSTATATNYTASNKYVSTFLYAQIFKCDLIDDDTVVYTTIDGSYNDCAQSVILESIKIK